MHVKGELTLTLIQLSQFNIKLSVSYSGIQMFVKELAAEFNS